MRAIITGVGHYVPANRLTNSDLEKRVQTNDDWITSRTGIKERRILEDGKGSSYMASKAAERALAVAGVKAGEIDLIIVATVTPDMMVPSAAAFVQHELRAVNCWGFDLNGGCTGFLYALTTGAQFIESGRHDTVLVIGADKMSSIIDYEDRNTCVLFGDGAGAVLLKSSEDETAGIEDFILHLDGAGAKHLFVPGGGSLHPATHETVDQRLHYVNQDGKTVFKYAVTGMADVTKRILENNHLTIEDIKLYIPHQANSRIIDAVSTKMKLSREQVVINIDKYGNTTAATIPIALSESFEAKLMTRGDRILISAFGAGFTWGSVLFKWVMN